MKKIIPIILTPFFLSGCFNKEPNIVENQNTYLNIVSMGNIEFDSHSLDISRVPLGECTSFNKNTFSSTPSVDKVIVKQSNNQSNSEIILNNIKIGQEVLVSVCHEENNKYKVELNQKIYSPEFKKSIVVNSKKINKLSEYNLLGEFEIENGKSYVVQDLIKISIDNK